LNARAIRCAQFLTQQCGLRHGVRFALLAHNRVEYFDTFFAAAKAGLIFVPLNARHTPVELEHVIRDCGSRVLLYEEELKETARALWAAAGIEQIFSLDPATDESASLYTSFIASADAANWRNVRCSPEDVLCLLYTSGTTGKPKGVRIPHRMVAWNGYNTAVCWQLREDDVSPIFTPLYHAGGLGAFLVPIFTIGGTMVLHRGFNASEIWCTMEKEKCTVVLGVPTIYKLLMDAPEFATTDLSHVRWFISGGAPLPMYIIEAYQRRGVVFKQGYGLTEVGVNCFSMTTEESVRKAGSIGKPLMQTEARLVDESGREVPVGEVGELWLRGPHVSQGYWNNPEATAAALDSDGWFHTGDKARKDEEGFFYIAGRAKDMFISGGVNVYPAEIEGQLLLHHDVQDAAVIGVEQETWGEVGVAFVVVRSGANVTAEELTQFLEPRLAKYKIPKEFHFVAELPRTPYGKVVKNELQELYKRIHLGRSDSGL
ncbi:MAG TPA: AMP-binding protein, partial [Candidatus Nitrosotenuis sp.]|nr:AMP-binding protein [Candidatus Nitrosotenuis sp.]